MRLDYFTFAFTGLLVAVLMGGAMLASARHSKDGAALGWWGAGYLTNALAIGLFAIRGSVTEAAVIIGANALLLSGSAFIWCGLRRFEGRAESPWVGPLAVLVWLGLCAIPAFYASIAARVIVASLLSAFLSAMWAFELWRGRGERLPSRRPLMVVAALHACCMVVRIGFAINGHLPSIEGSVDVSHLSQAVDLSMIFFAVIGGLLLVSMSKERAERVQRNIARVDGLTGVLNRGTFTAEGGRLLATARRAGTSVALVVFDIDRFKRINDTFGHPTGDRVIRRFAACAAESLREGDMLGRIGGEEFAVLLAGAAPQEAMAVAERVRNAFASAAREHDGPAATTVSGGVACARAQDTDLADLMMQADRALYRAKRMGRDRIVADTTIVPIGPTAEAGVSPIRPRPDSVA